MRRRAARSMVLPVSDVPVRKSSTVDDLMNAAFSVPVEMPLLAAVLESSPDAWWIIGPDMSLLHFNSAFHRLCLKVSRVEPAVGMALARMADPRSQPLVHQRWQEVYRRILSGRTVASDEWYDIDGAKRCLSISGTPVIVGGRIAAAAVHARDVTAWQREVQEDVLELALTRAFATDEPLSQSIERALAFLCDSDAWDAAIAWLVDDEESSLEPAVIWTGTVVHADEFHRRVEDLRFPRGRGLPGRCWAAQDLVCFADLMDESGMVRATIASVVGLHSVVAVPLLATGRMIGVLELFTGPVRPLGEQHKASLRRAASSLTHLIDRRRAEIERSDLLEMIKRKGDEWAITFDSIDLPIFLTATDGASVSLNRAARDFARREYRELTGVRIDEVHPGEPWKTLGDVVSAVRDSGTACTARIYDPGADRTWDVSGSLSRSAPGAEEWFIVILREITAVVRLQESVARGEQLAALGELVAGVAHQIRNPVFGISALVDGLEQRERAVDPDAKEMRQGIRRWLERLSGLMEDLIQYGRTWRLDLGPGELADVLRQAIAETSPLAEKGGVTIESNLENGIRILMDPGRLVQAFENLLTNAIQHSPAGGRIFVAVGRVWEREDLVECSVRDEGPGFAEADLHSVFQPFFTRRRGGTGLGLSIVQRTIDEHGGTVVAANGESGGALMTATFPVYQDAATPETGSEEHA